MKTKHCPLCRHHQLFTKYNFPKFNIIQCKNCHLLIRDKRYSVRKIKSIYSKKYFTKVQKRYFSSCLDNKAVKEKNNHRILDFINRLKTIDKLNIDNDKDLFDIGCATGTFLLLAKEAGFKVSGIDVSRFAINLAKKEQLPVSVSSIESYQSTPNQYSIITAWEVFPNFEKPDKAIKNIKSILNQNGILAIQLTVTDSLIFFLCHLIYQLSFGKIYHCLAPAFSITHSQYFSRKILNRLLIDNGFTIVKKENVDFNFRFSKFPKILLPLFNLISFFSKLIGKTTQYRVYAKQI